MIVARHLVPNGLSSPLFTRGLKRRGVKKRLRRTVGKHRARRLQKQTVASTSADPSSASLNHSKQEEVKSHAALHDFCMTIPYGGVVAVIGLFGCFAGYGNLATIAAFTGAVTCLSSYCSWKAWRLGQSNSRYTMASAGLATAVGSLSWRMTQASKGKMAGNVMIALSSLLILFLVYNLAAGGNPPKRH